MGSVTSDVVGKMERAAAAAALAAKPEVRKECIKEALRPCLSTCEASDRGQLLAALLRRFPAAGLGGSGEGAQAGGMHPDEYKVKLREIAGSKASLELELKKARSETEEQRQQCNVLASKVREYEAALQDQRRQLTDLQEQAGATAERAASAEAAARDHGAKAERLEGTLSEMAKTREEMGTRARSLEMQIQELRATIARLEEELARGGAAATVVELPAPAGARPEVAGRKVEGRLPAEFVDVLTAHVRCLSGQGLDNSADTGARLAECLAAIVVLLGRVEQTTVAHLKFLSKYSDRIGGMSNILMRQKLLSIEDVLAGSMTSTSGRITKLKNYCDLLWRWWTSAMLGVQATMEEAESRLEGYLEPKTWHVPPRKFMRSEEETSWEHFDKVIRRELPPRFKDDQRRALADKTYEAYASTRFPTT